MLTTQVAIAVFVLATQRPAAQPDDESALSVQHGPAEQAPPGEGVVQMMKDGGTRFELLDTGGVRHKASLVQIDGDNVVLKSGKDVFTVPVDQLQRSTRRGDSPWDGALIGLSVGGGIWALAAQSDPAAVYRWKSDNPDDWTVKDTISVLCFSTTVGYIIDALHVGKHTVFVGPMRSAKRQSALTVAASGKSGERRVQVGYRIAF